TTTRRCCAWTTSSSTTTRTRSAAAAQEYALYALANRRVSVRPRVMRSGTHADAMFWEIEYLGGGGGSMWARFAPTLADAMDVVYATRHARERGHTNGETHA
ncbi:hypothetical protein, partial [Micrococcus sp. F3Y]|uniref:hypothetical protein n=1 Tax=Micrococcus sp. F3Y TaxID=3402627 RepID=UPI003AF58683